MGLSAHLEITPSMAACLDMWLQDEAFGTSNKTTVICTLHDAARTIEKQLDAVADCSNDGTALVDLLLLALRIDANFNSATVVACFRDLRTLRAFRRLDMDNDMKAMAQLDDILRQGIPDDVRRSTIEAPVRSSLARATTYLALLTSLDDPKHWTTPSIDAPDVPIAIVIVQYAFNDAKQPDATRMTTVLGDLLVKNLAPAESPLQAKLWAVAKKHGCNHRGFPFELTSTKVQSLIIAMKKELQPDAKAISSEVSLAPVNASPLAGHELIPTDGRPMSFLRTVSPAPSKDSHFGDLVLHVLKHGLSFKDELYTKKDQASSSTTSPVVYDALLSSMASLTPAARAEVIRHLVDRCCLAPLVVPMNDAGFDMFTAEFGLVETSVNGKLASLIRDTSCTRVAVVSERPTKNSTTSDWIKNIFHAESLHCCDRLLTKTVTKRPCVAELGWGFVVEGNEMTPVMVLHIIGDYMLLESFITQFADILIVDAGYKPVRTTLPHGLVIQWRAPKQSENDESDEDAKTDETSDSNGAVTAVALICDMGSSREEIAQRIVNVLPSKPRVPVECLRVPDIVKPTTRFSSQIVTAVAKTNFATLRSKDLKLQMAFKNESSHSLHFQRQQSERERKNIQIDIDMLQQACRDNAECVLQYPLFQIFVAMLKLPSAASREMCILDFERQIATASAVISDVAHTKYISAVAAASQSGDASATQSSLKEWDNAVTGMEHLWRELSLVYRSDPTKYSDLPDLAVTHLLDGFPLEYMNGDAGMVNKTWVRAILRQLGKKLGDDARIFVLSVAGVQSSGKSTLLNAMFGIRLKTSVARCTRGVTMQLLPCDSGNAYDYILLLDTEGMQSPERVGMKDSVWRDNRMASVAILPADATILLMKGESTNVIDNALPIVLSVFGNSSLAAASEGRLQTKLYFVLNQINAVSSNSLVTCVSTLTDNLRKNAAKIGLVCQSKEPAFSEFLADFRGFNCDEDKRDVRVLGYTRMLPLNVPKAEYGIGALKMRDHMHNRATESDAWRARTVPQLSASFDLVQMCLEGADFDLNFASALERIQYAAFVKLMTQYKQDLALIHTKAFDVWLCHVSNAYVGDDDAMTRKLEDAEKKRKDNINAEVSALEKTVQETLKHNDYETWSLAATNDWKKTLQDQADHSQRKVKATRVFQVGKDVKKFEAMFLERVAAYVERVGGTATMDHVKNIFNDVLAEARKLDMPLALSVKAKVHKVIHEHGLFSPDLLTPQDAEVALESTAAKTSTAQVMWSSIFAKHTQSYIKSTVQGCVRCHLGIFSDYDDSAVRLCAEKVRDEFIKHKFTKPEQKRGIAVLITTLGNELTQRQAVWDANNSVADLFVAQKNNLMSVAGSICRGRQAVDLLVEVLSTWLTTSLSKALHEELESAIAAELQFAPWVESPEAMQAALDHDISLRLEALGVTSVLPLIRDPKAHAADVIAKLVLAKVEARYESVRGKLIQNVSSSIDHAASVAGKTASNRSKSFGEALQRELQRHLKLSGASAFIQSLPPLTNGVMNCDAQGPSIFDDTSSRMPTNVPRRLHETLVALTPTLAASVAKNTSVAKAIAEALQTESYCANYGIAPRCGEPCPKCRCPCTKEQGHASKDGSRHDTYHQPSGLQGATISTWYFWKTWLPWWTKANELCPHSCVSAVANNDIMELESGKTKAFKDFEKVFPYWSLPHGAATSLPLREHIFAHYQTELSQYFEVDKCIDIPASYFAHDIKDIQQQLERMLC
ncbi:hypothetical protein SDRG_02770 [Saprolegnia diclina VS20]|uniref:VLIG-type G domain-containing protein n=1 Tax=Saprolegnia diclina (strain VS20) TaxID=1156394 RepID=T0S4V4_SAPDV|nr:hypothetical protein SDRG_02770 [Saprolegnia diclina VS20]EQC40118.1 hypothetical protein SDRG_02770 [Saprolegnia diclina VS20]|eukprot:XP_008606592.1 hypothetical protein SDRG_02770 [Saprolegnia diclina VS20]